MTRRVVLASLVVAALLVVVGTGGVSQLTVDRSTEAAVVPDEQAYLGVETVDRSLEAGHHEVRLVSLENRFGTALTDVDVVIRDEVSSPPIFHEFDTPEHLEPGESGSVTATVVCGSSNTSPLTETWTVSVVASGERASVELARSVTITCERNTPEKPDTPKPTDPANSS